MFKDEVGGKIMEEFVGIRPNIYACLKDGYENDDYDKRKL